MSSISSWRRTSARAVLMFSLIAACPSAEAQQLSWMRAFGAEGDEVAVSLAVDGDGNTLVAGYFESVVDVDPGPGEELLVSNGQNDAFVMKLDAAGTLIWVLQVGGASADYATGVSVDAAGNVYVTGAFNEVVDFDPGAGVAELTSAGEHDIFLAKYSPAGAYLGSWGMGGPGYDEPKCVAAGPQGNVYLLSYFTGTIDADPGSGVLATASQGQLDMLVQRFTSDGELVWAQGTGSSGADLGLSMALDSEENIWITGSFEGTVDFDPGPASSPLTSAGAWDIFVTKRSADGTLVWAGSMGGVENFDTGYDIALDAEGNAIVTGSFFGSGDFDPGAGVHTLTASSLGSDDVFVQKLSPSGELLWAKALGGEGADLGYGVGVTSDGRIMLTGFFSGTADFDPDPTVVFELTTSSAANFFDSFRCELGPDGAFLGASPFGGAGSIATQPIAIGPDDAVTIAGHFENTADMDPGDGVAPATSGGFRDAFVVRLADATASLPDADDGAASLLFPNPATDHLMVEVDPSVVGARYTVLDEQGRLAAQGRVDGTRLRIDLSGFAAGSYQLHVRHPGMRCAAFVVAR